MKQLEQIVLSEKITLTHIVLGSGLLPPYPDKTEQIIFGLGCFWGAERCFWRIPGVYVTMVGYAGGDTVNPSYQDVCSGTTNHCEAVRVIYDPRQVSFNALLKVFWEAHDPTQGPRQGNDVGTQYRSAIYSLTEYQHHCALKSKVRYQALLSEAGRGKITTEILLNRTFYYAEDYHQQCLAKNPDGYCGLRGTGVCFVR